jgi:hypothetical protein
MPLVDSHISKKVWKELFDSTTFKLTATFMKKVAITKREPMNIQDWVVGFSRNPLVYFNLDNRCLKGLASQVQRSDLGRKIKKVSWRAFWPDIGCMELAHGLAATCGNVTWVLV